jgi:hypothetical protein
MNKGGRRRIVICLCTLLLAATFAGSAQAQENTVAGNTYALYFLTFPNDNFRDLDEAGLTHSHVTFTDGGGVDVAMIDGHGLYVAVPGFFVASYFAVGVRMGFESMDVYSAMSGINFNPYVFGVGFFYIDYTDINPYIFYGFQLFDSSM